MSDNIKDHINVYRNVFFALLILTAATVGASYFDFGVVAAGVVVFVVVVVAGLAATQLYDDGSTSLLGPPPPSHLPHLQSQLTTPPALTAGRHRVVLDSRQSDHSKGMITAVAIEIIILGW